MEEKGIIHCIDAGTENCPCFLALTGDCLTCSRLQNKDYCNCSWNGACIYNEFVLAGNRVNNPRGELIAPIVKKVSYEDDLSVYVIHVGKGMAIKSSVPGSYIFMKSTEGKCFYEVPISVMAADTQKGILHMAIRTISAKTKMLAEEKEKFIIRGPYRNGIIGVKKFTQKKGNTLIICRGVGIAPAVFAVNYLCAKGGEANDHEKIDIIIDTEKTNREMALDYLPGGTLGGAQKETQISEGEKENPINIKYMKLSDEVDKNEIKDLMRKEKYEKVGIFASDYFISLYGKMAKAEISGVCLAVSNNFNICCGEGICGACSMVNEKGVTIKMCKCQVEAEEIFREYEVK